MVALDIDSGVRLLHLKAGDRAGERAGAGEGVGARDRERVGRGRGDAVNQMRGAGDEATPVDAPLKRTPTPLLWNTKLPTVPPAFVSATPTLPASL